MFKEIFTTDKKIIIGAIHLPPMPGYADFPGMVIALENALLDLAAYEEGGSTATIFENNYDVPHTEFVTPEIATALTTLGKKIAEHAQKPLGISVLWNDYKTALTTANNIPLQFVRIPVFVDKVKTSYGIIEGHADAITKYRRKLGTARIALFTDIHVKHAELVSPYSLAESAKKAIDHGSDALIITGSWTGDPPDVKTIIGLRKTVGDFPIIIGSGLDKKNARELLSIANGAIVATSLKEGTIDSSETNLTKYAQRISRDKVLCLVQAL